jgi:NAD/NADP transhydrogenase beta subunit
MKVTHSIIRFVNIILAALLAGVSFGIWIGFNPLSLSSSTYVEQQQNMLHSLRILMIALVIIATLITLISAYIQRNNSWVMISLLIAAAFFITCILITRFGIKPIDDTVMSWDSSVVPANWTDLRDKWWSLHILRTIAELIALCIVVWTNVTNGYIEK